MQWGTEFNVLGDIPRGKIDKNQSSLVQWYFTCWSSCPIHLFSESSNRWSVYSQLDSAEEPRWSVLIPSFSGTSPITTSNVRKNEESNRYLSLVFHFQSELHTFVECLLSEGDGQVLEVKLCRVIPCSQSIQLGGSYACIWKLLCKIWCWCPVGAGSEGLSIGGRTEV